MIDPAIAAPASCLVCETALMRSGTRVRLVEDFALVRMFGLKRGAGIAPGAAKSDMDCAVFRFRPEEVRVFGRRAMVDRAASGLLAEHRTARLLDASAGFRALAFEGIGADRVLPSMIAMDTAHLTSREIVRTRVGAIAAIVWRPAPGRMLLVFETPYADHVWRLLQEIVR